MSNTLQGWIKLHRKMESLEWYTDIPVKVLFLHLLLKANHAPAKWRGTTVERGELLTSLPLLAEQTGLSVQQVRTALKKLEQTGEISVIATNEGRRIKCCHYTVYQAPDLDEQQTSNRQATDEQHLTIIIRITIIKRMIRNGYRGNAALILRSLSAGLSTMTIMIFSHVLKKREDKRPPHFSNII